MALVTVEGTYEDGKIALAELPEGMERARVMVTFLPVETVPAVRNGAAESEDETRRGCREAGERLLEMMRRGINFGGEKFNREEIYEERTNDGVNS